MEPALSLKDVAALLGVSYSTVYEHRLALGFFKIGNQWRVWPETLRRNLEEKGQQRLTDETVSSLARRSDAREQSDRTTPLRAEHRTAVARELDELLTRRPARQRTRPRRD